MARAFLDGLVSALPLFEYTVQAAEIAGKIDAEQKSKGLPVPLADLLIGATALSLGYSVLTSNERHFNMIPGLTVIRW